MLSPRHMGSFKNACRDTIMPQFGIMPVIWSKEICKPIALVNKTYVSDFISSSVPHTCECEEAVNTPLSLAPYIQAKPLFVHLQMELGNIWVRGSVPSFSVNSRNPGS